MRLSCCVFHVSDFCHDDVPNGGSLYWRQSPWIDRLCRILHGASVFLAFAHTFNRGAHVRIELFLTILGKHRHWAEKFSFVIASMVVVWLAYYAWWAIFWSFTLGDMSQGLDATPIWIPQMSMAIGLSIFALSVVDHSIRLLITGKSGLSQSLDAM